MRKYTVLFFVFIISACTQYHWVKPGTSQRQLSLDETECQAKSLRELHPDNVVMGKNTTIDREWDEVDTTYSREDGNEESREVLIRDCMYKKGWQQEVVNSNVL